MPDPRGVLALSAPAPPIVVLDTSAVVCALLVDQPQHEEYADFFERAVAAETTLVYSELLDLELADASMAIALRRQHGRDWARHRRDPGSHPAGRDLMHEVFSRWRETIAQTSSARLPPGPIEGHEEGSPVLDLAFSLLERFPSAHTTPSTPAPPSSSQRLSCAATSASRASPPSCSR